MQDEIEDKISIEEEKKIYFNNEDGDYDYDYDYSDKKTPLLAKKCFFDKITNFVINNLFKNYEDNEKFLIKFIKYVTLKLDDFKNKYKLLQGDIHIFYKGGNTMKNIFDNYNNKYSSLISQIFYDNYNEYFKKSDFDFQIFINREKFNNERDYNDIVDKLTTFLYGVLNNFRNYLLNNLEDFDLYRYKNSIKKEKLKKVLEELNNCDILKMDKKTIKENYADKYEYLSNNKFVNINFLDINTDNKYKDINFRRDFIIDNEENKKTLQEIKIPKLNNNLYNEYKGSELYISINKTLQFKNANNKIINFNLIRLKLNMNGYLNTNYTLPIGGEIIDISISKFNDYKIIPIEKIQKYKYKEFEYYMYTLDGFIFDTSNILFIERKNPWDDKKYEKRIYRLFYLLYIDIFNSDHNDIDEIKYLLESLKKSKNSNIDDKYKNFKNIFDKINNILNDNEDNKNKNNFIKIIDKNLQIGIDIIDKIKDYYNNRKTINNFDSNNNNINYLNKYKKYKQKYIELKKIK